MGFPPLRREGMCYMCGVKTHTNIWVARGMLKQRFLDFPHYLCSPFQCNKDMSF